jgi:hypothetical protein
LRVYGSSSRSENPVEDDAALASNMAFRSDAEWSAQHHGAADGTIPALYSLSSLNFTGAAKNKPKSSWSGRVNASKLTASVFKLLLFFIFYV